MRILSGWAFTEPGAYLNETSQLLLYLAFALIGLALAGVNAAHPRRPFFILFFIYAVTCVLSFVIPGSPLGNNIGRFFFVFGLPLLLLLRHTSLKRPFRYGDLARRPHRPLRPAPDQHALQPLHAHQRVAADGGRASSRPRSPQRGSSTIPNYRIHVVALRRHWEAAYFPEAGIPITRGWYRQADAIHNSLFYTTYDEAAYVAWLRRMGVQYIFLPHAPLDVWSNHEARLLETSPAFAPVTRAGAWSVYRLRVAEPIVVGLDGGTADVLTMRHLWFTVPRRPAGLLPGQGHLVAVLDRARGGGRPDAHAGPLHGPATRRAPARTRCASTSRSPGRCTRPAPGSVCDPVCRRGDEAGSIAP